MKQSRQCMDCCDTLVVRCNSDGDEDDVMAVVGEEDIQYDVVVVDTGDCCYAQGVVAGVGVGIHNTTDDTTRTAVVVVTRAERVDSDVMLMSVVNQSQYTSCCDGAAH